MNKLYKYTSQEYIEDALLYGVHASRLDNVNDPYEVEGIRYPDKYRVACLTNSNNAMLLWSYYVGHRGCCISYELSPDVENIIMPIKYTEEIEARRDLDNVGVINSLFTKGKEWAHEHEYRAVYFEDRDKDSNYWKKHNDEIFLNLRPIEIYFGVLSSSVESYQSTLRIIQDYNHDKDSSIKCFGMYKRDDKYGLRIDRQFNLMDELQ